MFFPESERLAHERNDLRELLGKLDSELASFSPQAPIDPRTLAFIIGSKEAAVRDVCVELEKRGLLRSVWGVECVCGAWDEVVTLTPESQVCGVCDRPIPGRAPKLLFHLKRNGPKMADEQVDANRAPENPLDRMAVIRETVKQIPQLKILFGLVGLATTVSSAFFLFKSPFVAAISLLVGVGLLVLIVLLINIVDLKDYKWQAKYVVTVVTIAFSLFVIAGVLSVFANWPLKLQERINHL